MYYPEKMKHNKFVQVKCPKPSDIFSRVGMRPVASGAYTGDLDIHQQSKMDALREAEETFLQEKRDEEFKKRQELDSK